MQIVVPGRLLIWLGEGTASKTTINWLCISRKHTITPLQIWVQLNKPWTVRRQAHYPCQEPSCLEQKFVVFGSELDWKAHMMQEVSRRYCK